MNYNDAFPSKWLKADDLPAKTRVSVVISRVELEEIGDGRKLALYFRGKEKGLVCNKTNADIIGHSFGKDTDEWIGKAIKLYATTTPYNGKMTPCIRVYEEPPADEVPGDGEDIPF